jgi:hypothetical protein
MRLSKRFWINVDGEGIRTGYARCGGGQMRRASVAVMVALLASVMGIVPLSSALCGNWI